MGDINSFTLANCRYSYYIDTILLSWHVCRLHIALKHHYAGTNATSRTLILANQDIYNTLSANAIYLPDNWKQGTEGTTMNFK